MRTPQRTRLFALVLLAFTLLINGCDTFHDTDYTAPEAPLNASRGNLAGGGEIWVTAQDASEIKIVRGMGHRIETVSLPSGSGPHEITFSPSGKYAYIANVGNGSLIVMRARDREVLDILNLGDPGAGDVGTHQATASPDGSIVLVAQIQSNTLFKLAADENAESWTVVGSLILPESPICIAFREDGQQAYVSLGPSGIAVVDVAALSLVKVLPTDGSVQCGLVNSKRENVIYVDSRGETLDQGNFYILDAEADLLTLFTAFPAQDLHGFDVNPSEQLAFAAERGGDALKVIDLTSPASLPITILLDPRPEEEDRPDKVAVQGNNVYVTLRAAGQLAVVKGNQGTVHYIDLVEPSPNALHGVAIRP